MVAAVRVALPTKGRSQAGHRHGALLNRQAPCQQPACVASSKVRRFVSADRPADRSGRERIIIGCPLRTSCRSSSPTGQENEIAPVVCRLLVGSLPRATVTGFSPKAKAAFRMASLVWRNGVRTFAAASCKRTSQSYLLGALAAAPGSVAMLRASSAGFPCGELHGFERVALPLHFSLNAHAVVLSNLRLS